MNAPLRSRFDIRPVSDPETRRDVFRFRYRVYVEMMGRRQKHADHVAGTIEEPLDCTATIFAAYLDGAVVGTIRGNRMDDPAAQYYRRLYGFDRHFDYDPAHATLSTKLMVLPALQRTALPVRLISEYAEHHGYRMGSRIDFLDCNKPLIGFFQRWGYVLYRGWAFHSEFGTVMPMCCPTDQISRLERLRSPLAMFASSYYADNAFGGTDLAMRLDSAAGA